MCAPEATSTLKSSARLFVAICHGKPIATPAEIKTLKEKGADVNYQSTEFFSTLTAAVSQGNLPATKTLIELGADINQLDGFGNTALVTACSADNPNIKLIKYLLGSGANTFATNCHGEDTLNIAWVKKLFHICDLIHDKRAAKDKTYVQSQQDHADNMIEAAASGDMSSFQKARSLIHSRFINQPYCGDSDQSIEGGDTALITACRNGHEAIVQELLSDSSQPQRAAGSITCVDLNSRNDNDETALIAASIRGHSSIVTLLLDARANVNHQDIRGGNSALIYATLLGHTDIVNKLIAARANVNCQNGLHHSALTWFLYRPLKAKNGRPLVEPGTYAIIVQALLQAGADPDPKNPSGDSVLLLKKISDPTMLEMIANARQARHISYQRRVLTASMTLMLISGATLYYANKSLTVEHLNLSSYLHSARLHPLAATALVLAAVLTIVSIVTAAYALPSACQSKPAIDSSPTAKGPSS